MPQQIMLPGVAQCNGVSIDTLNKCSKMSAAADENGNSKVCPKVCRITKALRKPQASLDLLPPMPEGLEPLKHQLAGHKFGHIDNSDLYGILDCKDGSILKPVMSQKKGQREKFFYELVNGDYNENAYFRKELYTLDIIRQLSKFTPTFLGMISLSEHPDVVYIKMEDESHGLLKPHILDVKIGAKPWEPEASHEKQQRQKLRCPHLDEIGFQILGARYYDCETRESITKLNLRTFTPHDLLYSGLFDIFRGLPCEARIVILEQILSQLNSISEWFSTQSYISFHGSSLLIVFEGEPNYLKKNVTTSTAITQLHRLVKVKMIDFVHVWEASKIDSNYLEGLRSLETYFSKLLDIFKAENRGKS